MKAILGLLMLLVMVELHADEIRVRKMTKDGEMERSFVLSTNLKEKVVIDCQSFIQGLRIGEYEQAFTYFLDPAECDGLQVRIKSSLRKFRNHCIDVDQNIRIDYICD
jgi:hypothetical protein